MKFIVSRDVLYKNLSMVSSVMANNNTMPILDNFLFSIEDETLTVTASDVESTMIATMELSNVEGSGATAINAKTLLETLRNLPETPIIFDIDTDRSTLTFTAANGKYNAACYPGEEYPAPKEMVDASTFTIEAGVLHRAINKTMFATGNDEIRPVMMGIFCELSSEGVTFVATDANKLVQYTNRDIKVDEVTSFIIPKKSAGFLKNVLGNFTDMVTVEYNNNSHYIKYSVGNIVMLTSLKEGRYPAYQGAIPKEVPNKLVVSRVDLLRAVSRVSLYGSKSTFAVRVTLHENGAYITAEDLDYASKGEDEVVGEYTGEPMSIGFNAKFLREMLENVDGERISLNMVSPSRAAIILPTEEYSEHESLLMVCMPIMLNN